MSLITNNSSKVVLEASSKGHIFTKGPNEQAIGLQHKYGGAVRSLVPQYVTPSSVDVPSFKADVVYHLPGNYNPNISNLNNHSNYTFSFINVLIVSISGKLQPNYWTTSPPI